MGIDALEPYYVRESAIHRLDARVKLVTALALIVAINITPVRAWPALAVELGAIVAVVLAARVPPQRVLKRSLFVAPFALIAAIGLPFVHEGRVIAEVPLLWGALKVTEAGALRFANVMARAWLSVLASVTLMMTTPFIEVARGLRSLGLPALLVAIILLMYRYMHVLVEETQRMLRARDARSAAQPGMRAGGALRWRARVAGHMVATLFLRTYERSERIYYAMLARGYSGEIRTLDQGPLPRAQRVAGGLVLALLAVVALWANLYW